MFIIGIIADDFAPICYNKSAKKGNLKSGGSNRVVALFGKWHKVGTNNCQYLILNDR